MQKMCISIIQVSTVMLRRKSWKSEKKRPRGYIAHLSHIGYEHMQRYFSLLPLDHLASKFVLFLALSVLEKIFKDFPH
jgi:hypothetical protein